MSGPAGYFAENGGKRYIGHWRSKDHRSAVEAKDTACLLSRVKRRREPPLLSEAHRREQQKFRFPFQVPLKFPRWILHGSPSTSPTRRRTLGVGVRRHERCFGFGSGPRCRRRFEDLPGRADQRHDRVSALAAPATLSPSFWRRDQDLSTEMARTCFGSAKYESAAPFGKLPTPSAPGIQGNATARGFATWLILRRISRCCCMPLLRASEATSMH